MKLKIMKFFFPPNSTSQKKKKKRRATKQRPKFKNVLNQKDATTISQENTFPRLRRNTDEKKTSHKHKSHNTTSHKQMWPDAEAAHAPAWGHVPATQHRKNTREKEGKNKKRKMMGQMAEQNLTVFFWL